MKTLAIIPFYNEGTLLKEVVKKVLKYVDYILAIDDGSTDNSSDSLKNIPNVEIIKHDKNLGKGAALRTGISNAINKDFELILTIDADLQHAPEYIPKYIEKISVFDLVVGNRLSDLSSMPIPRRISNTLTSKLLTMKTKKKILDSQCGFRLYKKDIIKNLVPKYNGFEAETEMLVKAAKLNYKIGFVEIPTIYGNEVSKMRNFEATKGFLKVLIKE